MRGEGKNAKTKNRSSCFVLCSSLIENNRSSARAGIALCDTFWGRKKRKKQPFLVLGSWFFVNKARRTKNVLSRLLFPNAFSRLAASPPFFINEARRTKHEERFFLFNEARRTKHEERLFCVSSSPKMHYKAQSPPLPKNGCFQLTKNKARSTKNGFLFLRFCLPPVFPPPSK